MEVAAQGKQKLLRGREFVASFRRQELFAFRQADGRHIRQLGNPAGELQVAEAARGFLDVGLEVVDRFAATRVPAMGQFQEVF